MPKNHSSSLNIGVISISAAATATAIAEGPLSTFFLYWSIQTTNVPKLVEICPNHESRNTHFPSEIIQAAATSFSIPASGHITVLIFTLQQIIAFTLWVVRGEIESSFAPNIEMQWNTIFYSLSVFIKHWFLHAAAASAPQLCVIIESTDGKHNSLFWRHNNIHRRKRQNK